MIWFKRYQEKGIIGINARNSQYIFPHNKRRYFQLVDDKVATKMVAQKAGIAVPEHYETVAYQAQLKDLAKILAPYDSFVIKPALGSGGQGIMVIEKRRGEHFIKASGDIVTLPAVQHHISNILSGLYSLGGQSDKAIIEYRVEIDPVFSDISWKGVPDIRVLLYRGIPAMAMLRLPTRASDGKANLHMGGIGCGIDLETGVTTTATQGNRYITHHPETDVALRGHTIPDWQNILDMASQFYGLTKLGYLGVDIVLDKNLGALVLEVNARPGISIQIANKQGLKPILNRIDRLIKESQPKKSIKSNQG